jgi:predicted TIM-barrel fold metal-dependent hydrolase
VLHHAWYKTGSRAFNESTPADIADLASRFPDVTIIMAHLSGGGVQGIHDVKPHSNVYVDTSGSQPVSGMVEYAVHVLGSQRIVYGSDAPIRDFSSQIGRIRGASITEKQRDRILCSNAKKIFRLD